ncbi:MAG: IclR family transcriptional regulator [Clostridiaceae bacterium]|nr:IclR family transcriptional regulator [Clostridiaceae bacterium]
MRNEEKDDKIKAQGNQSSVKLLKVFEHLVLKREPQRLLDIANDLKMNSSTVLRFLATLVNEGYVEQNEETLKYFPTYKICALANNVNNYVDMRMIARPYMEQLAKIFGESVCMAVEENMRSVYIEVIRESNQSLMMVQSVGNAVPMHCTGNGKVMLLNYSEEDLDKLIRVEGLARYTENTLTSKWQLVRELEKIRERGFAYDEEERELGARCVAFPIYNYTGKVVAGLSVTGPKNRMTDELIEPRLDDFRRISLEISKKLGYDAFNY